MHDLGSVFWGFALAKAPFNCSSELEGTNINLPKLFPPQSPLKVFHAAAAFLHRGLKGGRLWGSRVVGPLVGTRATHMVPDACWARDLLAVLHLRPSRLAIIISPWEFGPALTSYRTHRHTSNIPTDGANCRVTIFGSSPLQWICREWGQKLGSDEMTTVCVFHCTLVFSILVF